MKAAFLFGRFIQLIEDLQIGCVLSETKIDAE